MDVRALSPASALSAQSIRKAQERFDAASARVAAAAEAMTDEEDPGGGSDLPGAVVGMQEEAVVNRILFGVFKAQARQQEAAANLLDRT